MKRGKVEKTANDGGELGESSVSNDKVGHKRMRSASSFLTYPGENVSPCQQKAKRGKQSDSVAHKDMNKKAPK